MNVSQKQLKTAGMAAMAIALLGMTRSSLAATAVPQGVVVDNAAGGNNHAYELVLDSTSSWSQAESTAVAAGGYLTTPSSSEQTSFIDQILTTDNATTGSYWIGLTREPNQLLTGGTGAGSTDTSTPTSSAYYFVTGAPMTYTNWQSGLPDNYDNNEDSGSIKWTNASDPIQSEAAEDGKWNDLPNAGYTPGNTQFTGDLVRAGYVVEWNSSAAAGSGISVGTTSSIPLPSTVFMFMTGVVVAMVAIRRNRRPHFAMA